MGTHTEGAWLDLRRAVEALTPIHDVEDARLDLLKEMESGRLRSRALRWVEENPPRTWKVRPLAKELEYGGTEIPNDFWQRQHVREEERNGSYLVPATKADWKLLRFETRFQVNGGNPNFSDRWGSRWTGHGPKTWIWTRIAIGVSIDAGAFNEIVRSYGLTVKSDKVRDIRGYAIADEPLILRALQMTKTGEARSAFHAATLLAPEAQGQGPDAIISRLRRAIRARFKATLES